MSIPEILQRLESMGSAEAVVGMSHYGITFKKAYGVSMPELRKFGKELGKNHSLALELWQHDIRETRILAGIVDEPSKITEAQADNWVDDFDSWEVCDQAIMNVLEKTTFAWEKAFEWSSSEKEFVKRAGFVMMARLAGSDKKAPDKKFLDFLPIIEKEAHDNRNFVKKAVNWALRGIGKRSLFLNSKAIKCAESISEQETKAAKWVAYDALRELKSDAVQAMLRKKLK